MISIIISCSRPPRLNLDKGIIPVIPKNFAQVNSEFDDYNSDEVITYSRKTFSLIFSTNRNSKGLNFDFINYECNIQSNLITGDFNIYANIIDNKLINSVNSNGNELGPYILYDKTANGYRTKELTDAEKRFFYASDIKGNLDIYMSNFTVNDYSYSKKNNTIELSAINSEFDDAYPTIYNDTTINKEIIYFTSNRDDKFNIYKAIGDKFKLINQSTNIKISKVNKLCSASDDKCPYINENIMVFTSNRKGGYGGFDLWYSTYTNDEWSEPKNFGEYVNTEYDEYRPIVCEPKNDQYLNNFLNNLMIFSSNRPGGKGGFDLYYVGINKTLK